MAPDGITFAPSVRVVSSCGLALHPTLVADGTAAYATYYRSSAPTAACIARRSPSARASHRWRRRVSQRTSICGSAAVARNISPRLGCGRRARQALHGVDAARCDDRARDGAAHRRSERPMKRAHVRPLVIGIVLWLVGGCVERELAFGGGGDLAKSDFQSDDLTWSLISAGTDRGCRSPHARPRAAAWRDRRRVPTPNGARERGPAAWDARRGTHLLRLPLERAGRLLQQALLRRQRLPTRGGLPCVQRIHLSQALRFREGVSRGLHL